MPESAEWIEWIEWARRYAEAHDPLRTAPRVPAPPESVPTEELRPFLDGWSPHGPERAWVVARAASRLRRLRRL